MEPVCHLIQGSRVTFTRNFTIRGVTVYNGGGGIVLSIEGPTVRVDVDYPLPVGHVDVPKMDLPEISLHNIKLKRLQFPLELAVAKTIHDVQGFTAASIATYLTKLRKHMMWSWSMFFTLLTRVEHLRDIWFCGFEEGMLTSKHLQILQIKFQSLSFTLIASSIEKFFRFAPPHYYNCTEDKISSKFSQVQPFI